MLGSLELLFGYLNFEEYGYGDFFFWLITVSSICRGLAYFFVLNLVSENFPEIECKLWDCRSGFRMKLR